MRCSSIALGLLQAWSVAAVYDNYFPPKPSGVTVLNSKHDPGVTLSYKETEVCEKSYSGYVHLPATDLLDAEGPPEYPANMFFWFFPARNSPETAPLAIWIGGGPGQAAIQGAMSENGPCYVSDDGNSTYTNQYSRNNYVNMLYVDQPVSAGFSYTFLRNVTYSQFTSTGEPTDFSKGIPFTPNATVFPGTISDPNPLFTANNSVLAARTMWHFAQIWFDEFPLYAPSTKTISLWTNSYGGYYGSAIFDYWLTQNAAIAAGTLKDAHTLHLDTLGIENGCIDGLSQIASWPNYAYNNTYGLQLINATRHAYWMDQINNPHDGCITLVNQYRAAAAKLDPHYYANDPKLAKLAALTGAKCFPILTIPETDAQRSSYDIAQGALQTFPGYQHITFFNRHWVQASLGVPVNYTDNPMALPKLYFIGTADPFRQTQGDLEHILSSGIKVALVYGDRDSRCNWIGVENVSMTVNYPASKQFRTAGYANIVTNDSYNGGVVRQYDGFSFSRVFEAGHQVSTFQPQTAYEIFMRAMFNKDIATGKVPTTNCGKTHYASKGPSSSWAIKNKLPPDYPVVCNLWAIPLTCTENQQKALAKGNAKIENDIVVWPKAM